MVLAAGWRSNVMHYRIHTGSGRRIAFISDKPSKI